MDYLNVHVHFRGRHRSPDSQKQTQRSWNSQFHCKVCLHVSMNVTHVDCTCKEINLFDKVTYVEKTCVYKLVQYILKWLCLLTLVYSWPISYVMWQHSVPLMNSFNKSRLLFSRCKLYPMLACKYACKYM